MPNCAIGLFECLSISEQGTKGVLQCLDFLRQVDFHFLVEEDVYVHKYNVPTMVHQFRVAGDAEIERIVEAHRQTRGEGNLSSTPPPGIEVLCVEHDLLEPGEYHAGNSSYNPYLPWPRGVCEINCSVDIRWINLRAVHEWGRGSLERHARAMLELARRLWKLMQPICAAVGLYGAPLSYSDHIRQDLARGKPFRWRQLEWASILSAELVADVGREFLLAAPWAEKEFWEDGAFLGITRSSYLHWLDEGNRSLLSYLRRKYPKLRRVKEPT